MGGRAYYEPLDWLWSPPPPVIEEDPETGWTTKSRRVGLIGVKMGMYPDYDEWGNFYGLTAIHIPTNYVSQVKTEDKEGYTAVQVGTGTRKEKNVTVQMKGHFGKAGVPLLREIREFRVTPDAVLPVGTEMNALHFMAGQYLDIQGTTIGKGFQGGMKRWGFKGMPASHGTSLTHRSIGSTGACQDPGRVWKGKKMAGRMGNKTRTVKNLFLFKIDPEYNLLFVRGHVPGHTGAFVHVTDAKNKDLPRPPPFPTYVPTGKEGTDLIYGKMKVPFQTERDGALAPPEVTETLWETRNRLAKAAYEDHVTNKGYDAADKILLKGNGKWEVVDPKNGKWSYERLFDKELPMFK